MHLSQETLSKQKDLYIGYTNGIPMRVTTVKVLKSTKDALNELKNKKESYDEVIRKLVAKVREKTLKDELIEGYKRMGKESLEILEEWESASAELENE